eukprot:1651717-Amphidinium_carterae.1
MTSLHCFASVSRTNAVRQKAQDKSHSVVSSSMEIAVYSCHAVIETGVRESSASRYDSGGSC